MQLNQPSDADPALPRSRGGVEATLAAALATALMPLSLNVWAESAPTRGTASVKSLNYQDSQPGSSRVRVGAQAFYVMMPVAEDWTYATTATVDAISGASPYVQDRVLTRLRDERRALDTRVTKYLPWGTTSVGANVSTEADYLSRGLSWQSTWSDPSRNTTWTVGLGHNRDVINPITKVVKDEKKVVTNVLMGLTWAASTVDLMQVNVAFSRGRGYHSDPYKFADDRPRQRDAQTLLVRWNHHQATCGCTWRSSWRYFRDDWGVRSHTVGLELHGQVGDWKLSPQLRLYSQTAAAFYTPPSESTYPFVPFEPIRYSEDHRLSAFGAATVGFKVSRTFAQDWTADFKYERYEQRGAWAFIGQGTQGLLPFEARSIQVGLSRSF